jgi:hypothetical protein
MEEAGSGHEDSSHNILTLDALQVLSRSQVTWSCQCPCGYGRYVKVYIHIHLLLRPSTHTACTEQALELKAWCLLCSTHLQRCVLYSHMLYGVTSFFNQRPVLRPCFPAAVF